MFAKSTMDQIKRLVRNLLWFGNDVVTCRSKVAWDVVIRPTKRGGLGIIDPICQSRALMVKFIVRGLLPGTELWKTMLFSRVQQCVPKEGQPWPISFGWLFAKNLV